MEFRKKIQVPESSYKIDHFSKILLMGSCFTENIGTKLFENKFDVNLNPFGVLYNPFSIKNSLEILLNEKNFSKEDLFKDKELYHSFYHHGSFSSTDADQMLEDINIIRSIASDFLFKSDIIILTFGTSYVYNLKNTAQVVSNCHKLPSTFFNRYRLSVTDIVEEWDGLIKKLKQINPSLKILFTVSPIRHWKDGAHGNQLSKATLLIAIDNLISKDPDNLFYFPAYELLLDELRDYRFYAEDMLHPNDVAIAYIWENFINTYFTVETKMIINQWQSIKKAINHRPFNTQTEEYKHFLRQTLLRINSLKEKIPYFDCSKEVDCIKTKIQN